MNTGIKNILIILLVIIFIFGCGSKEKESEPYDQVWVGMTKTEIVELIGSTNEKRYITKRNNQIQGPEKKFWHEIPMDAKLEVWTYHTKSGKLNLYFVGKSSELKYIASPK